MSQITYADKVTLNPQPDIADINKVTNSDMNMIKNAHNDTDTKLGNIGKLLWSGNFTTGSITIDGLSDYITIIAIVGGATCIGSLTYGVGGAGGYGSYSTSIYNYRFGVNGNTLTINNENRGGSNGTQNVAVTQIYGLF